MQESNRHLSPTRFPQRVLWLNCVGPSAFASASAFAWWWRLAKSPIFLRTAPTLPSTGGMSLSNGCRRTLWISLGRIAISFNDLLRESPNMHSLKCRPLQTEHQG